jgi:hypothetical protein
MAQEKITIEKLAEMSQREFLDIKKSMATGFGDVRSDIKLVGSLAPPVRNFTPRKKLAADKAQNGLISLFS